MNEDGEFSDESANMVEEFIVELPWYDVVVEESGLNFTTEVALHSYTRDPSLVCVDSGANIPVFKKKVGQGCLIPVENRSVGTAASGSKLRINGLFKCGLIKEIRLCPDSAANLLPTNDSNDCGCSVLLEKIDGVYSCIITADPHGDPFIIDCVRDNGLWWITEQQFLDIVVERNGLTVEEFERREIEQSAWVAELSRKRGNFSDRRGTDEHIDDQMFMNRMTEYILMETDRWGKAGERSELRALQVELWLQLATPSGNRIARRAGNEKGNLPAFSMQDELDLDELLRQELRVRPHNSRKPTWRLYFCGYSGVCQL